MSTWTACHGPSGPKLFIDHSILKGSVRVELLSVLIRITRVIKLDRRHSAMMGTGTRGNYSHIPSDLVLGIFNDKNQNIGDNSKERIRMRTCTVQTLVLLGTTLLPCVVRLPETHTHSWELHSPTISRDSPGTL